MELMLVGFRECLLRTFSGVGTISLIRAKVDLSGLVNVDLSVVEGETCSSDPILLYYKAPMCQQTYVLVRCFFYTQ